MTKSKRSEPIQEIASNSADELNRPMADAPARWRIWSGSSINSRPTATRRAQLGRRRRRDGRGEIAELPLLPRSPGRCDAPAHQESRCGARRLRTQTAAVEREAHRGGVAGARGRALPRRKSNAPPTGTISASSTMPRSACRSRLMPNQGIDERGAGDVFRRRCSRLHNGARYRTPIDLEITRIRGRATWWWEAASPSRFPRWAR